MVAACGDRIAVDASGVAIVARSTAAARRRRIARIANACAGVVVAHTMALTRCSRRARNAAGIAIVPHITLRAARACVTKIADAWQPVCRITRAICTTCCGAAECAGWVAVIIRCHTRAAERWCKSGVAYTSPIGGVAGAMPRASGSDTISAGGVSIVCGRTRITGRVGVLRRTGACSGGRVAGAVTTAAVQDGIAEDAVGPVVVFRATRGAERARKADVAVASALRSARTMAIAVDACNAVGIAEVIRRA